MAKQSMSKHLKYQLKKTLKKAEFVQADLEYHEQVGAEAKALFIEEVTRLLRKLPLDVQAKLRRYQDLQIAAEIAAKSANEKKAREDAEAAVEISGSACTDLVTTDYEVEPESDEDKHAKTIKMKTPELKKLFRRIAEITHPDKVLANGFSLQEAERSQKIFKKAKTAFDRDNWFVLYTIAIDLGIKLEEESERYVHWIEEDIKNTLHSIEVLANRTYWHWFSAKDENGKNAAVRHFFFHIYNFEYPGI